MLKYLSVEAQVDFRPMREPPGRASMRPMNDRRVAIASLVVLSAIGAELLAAYDDSTGRPLELLVAVAFFAALYGCPALLLREYARRTGRGWPAMLLLATAAGLLQAGVIDQSLFADRYGEVRDWEQWVQATYVEPFGISAYLAQGFVLGHVVFSFCAPIAVAEALRPAIAHEPWLRRRGIVVAAALWLLVAALIMAEESHATTGELAVTLALVAALTGAARGAPRAGRARGAAGGGERGAAPREFAAGRPERGAAGRGERGAASRGGSAGRRERGAAQRGGAAGGGERGEAPRGGSAGRRARGAAPRLRTVLVVSFVLAYAHEFPPATWAGFAVAMAAVASGVLLARAARREGWGGAHIAAVATGVLLARGALAFTYYPVVGETSAAQKYAHNVIMLTLVGATGAYAIRRASLPACSSRSSARSSPPRSSPSSG